MSRSKQTRGPVDEQRAIELIFNPWSTHTVVSVAVHRRGPDGRHSGRIATWHIAVTRADLVGHTTDDVLRVLLERVLRRLESGRDPADYPHLAVGTGAPLGATGGTVTNDPLPGL